MTEAAKYHNSIKSKIPNYREPRRDNNNDIMILIKLMSQYLRLISQE